MSEGKKNRESELGIFYFLLRMIAIKVFAFTTGLFIRCRWQFSYPHAELEGYIGRTPLGTCLRILSRSFFFCGAGAKIERNRLPKIGVLG